MLSIQSKEFIRLSVITSFVKFGGKFLIICILLKDKPRLVNDSGKKSISVIWFLEALKPLMFLVSPSRDVNLLSITDKYSIWSGKPLKDYKFPCSRSNEFVLIVISLKSFILFEEKNIIGE